MPLVLVTFAIVSGAMGFSMRPELQGTATMWLGLTIPYTLLAALAVYRMIDDGTLFDKLKWKAGDVTVGVLVAVALLAGAFAVRQFAMPAGSPPIAWLFRILLQIGQVGQQPVLVLVFLLLAVTEELVWRGMVQDALAEKLGTRRAWPAAAALYGVAHAPTLYTLSDPLAGPNPLLVVAALGCGAAWGYLTSRIGRLPPAILSHAAFIYVAPTLLLPKL